MLVRIYTYRFELFLASQIAILFGSLMVPSEVYETISPLLFYLNIVAGSMFLQSPGNTKYWKVILLLGVIGGVFTLSAFVQSNVQLFNYLRVITLFLFHLVIAIKIIQQVWQARLVNKNIIYGVISGFISLGFIGFFIYISIELIHPGSFSGLSDLGNANTLTERLMYFSYITLMTIGYGDILPLTHLSQKASILIGLIGQFYLVIITAIIVGKFINQTATDKESK